MAVTLASRWLHRCATIVKLRKTRKMLPRGAIAHERNVWVTHVLNKILLYTNMFLFLDPPMRIARYYIVFRGLKSY
jgi:hypothetical protein